MDNNHTVTINLTKEESLVLFEFLSRFSQANSLAIEDQSEERVLWDLTSQLEKVLIEPFNAEWGSILAAAQKKLRDEVKESKQISSLDELAR